METSEQINCPAPLPEDPADTLLTKMRTPAPYEVPEKTRKKAKGTRKTSRSQVVSNSSSDNPETHSSRENKEKEDEDSPAPAGEDKKRKAAPTGEAEDPRREGLSFGLLYHRRRRRRRVAAQGQAPSEVVSIRIPE